MVEMLEHVEQLENEQMPIMLAMWKTGLFWKTSFRLHHICLMKRFLAAIVGDSTECDSVCSDGEDEGDDEKLVSTKEAAQCFKKCLSWMESQSDIDSVQLMQLRRFMDFAIRSSYKSLKQTNILEHLRPF